MRSFEQQKTQIVEILLANRDVFNFMFKDTIKERLTHMHENSPLYHEKIDEDFSKIIKYRIMIEITRETGISSDIIKEVLETFDVLRYLEVRHGV